MKNAGTLLRRGMGLVALSLFGAGALGCGASEGDEDVPPIEAEPLKAQTPTAPGAEEVAGATFHGLAGIEDPVTLKNGRWEDPAPESGGASGGVAVLAEAPRLVGVFSGEGEEGDGLEETVAFVTSGGGGTGSFLNLAVVGRDGDRVISRAVAVIGDRVQLRDARVDGDLIVVDLVQHGEDDPLCCPGDLATRVWRLEGTQLVESQVDVTGRLHPASLTGTEWILRMWSEGDPVPDGSELTLVFEADQVSGSAGCNRYFSGYDAEGPPGAFRLGPVGATRMMCEPALMEVEGRYLALLGEVTAFGFWNRYLALSTSENGHPTRLLFQRR